MNNQDRSRQNHYGDGIQQDYYPSSAGYSAQRLPYPDAAAAHLHQQNALRRAHRNGIPQYTEEDIRYYDMMKQNDFTNVIRPINYKHPQNVQGENDHRRERLTETRDDERYAELYEEVFAPHSRTTISGTRTSTERTRGMPVQTSSSRSTSRYGSSTTSSSEFEDANWEDNIMSALNDMAGNFKKIGGIHCNQAGPDTTEVQLKLNLPLPMQYVDNLDVKEGFNNAIATLSPKKCGNMQYGYSHLDEHVIDMEERFLGTMDQIQGNIVPVYKSLFQNQSESSDDDDDDELDEDQSESTYEDPRFLPKVDPNLQQLQYETNNAVESSIRAQNIDGIPLQIILSNQSSGVSSANSWKLLSPRDEPREYSNKSATNNIITTINNNLDVAIRGSRGLPNQNESNHNEQWIPATKQTLEIENRETAEMEKVEKLKTRGFKSNTEIPQVINVKNEENVPECYSDLTTGIQMPGQANAEKDKSTSIVPTIKTQFSGDEIMGCSKASFQRNSIKKGTAFNPDLNDLTENEAVFVKSDPPTGYNDLPENEAVFVKSDPPTTKPASTRSHTRNESIYAPEVLYKDGDEKIGKIEVEEGPDDELVDNCQDEELEEEIQLREERGKGKNLKEERKHREAEAKAAQEALGPKRLEERVEAKVKATREELKAKKSEEERKQFEVGAKAAEEALEAKKQEEERKQREAETKLAQETLEAKRLEERVEAEIKAARESLKAKKLEEERKRMKSEAEAKAAQEALKARKLEEERKCIEAESKVAQEALEALYSKKLDEERRQREAEAKKLDEDEERRQLEAETKALETKKLKEVRKRIEVETKAKEEESKELDEQRKRIEAETKAVVEKTLEARKAEKERKRIEAEIKADPDEKERASLYKVQGFEDYCKSLASTQIDDDGNSKALRTSIDMSDEDTNSVEERSTSSVLESDDNSEENNLSRPYEEESSTGAMSFDEESNSSTSVDTYSIDEESDIFTEATSYVEDPDSKTMANTSDVRSASTTERLRNKIDVQSENVEIKYLSERTRSVNHPFSSEETVNTMDKTVQSFLTKDTSQESAGSSKSFSKLKLPMKAPKLSSAYTSDVPIPIASTMSTLQTFDQGTVHSGQHSLGRFIKSSDESVVSSASYSHQSVISVKPIALSVTALPRETKKKSKIEPESRSSILGRIVSFILSLVLRITFTIIIFSYTWIKHLVITIGKKRAAKIDCTPTQFALQPDQAIRREEIQDRSMDSRIHQNAIQQHRTPYLGYEGPHQEHYTTTMIMKPPTPSGYFADDGDEVGTCVESIVPDAHYPNLSDGKISTWKITQKNTETSSLSSPPSTSFRVLKSAYSAISSTKRESEKSNWLDQPTIDDEMSYYE